MAGYTINRNTFVRKFDEVTYLENQVNHVSMVLNGRDKRFVDSLSYSQSTEATDEHLDLAERLRSLWMLSADADDAHDFEYATKEETERLFAENGDKEKNGIPEPWLKTLEIIITSRCNERCIHCYIPNKEKDASTTLDKEQIKNAIRQFREMNGIKINLSGGEPLLHPDIWEILEYCREQDLIISLNSNMLMLTEEMADKLKALRMFNIQVSLYSMNSAVHDAITKRKGAFDRTRKSIEILVGKDIPVMISCPVMNENNDCVPDIQSYAHSLGIDCYFDPIMMAQSDGNADNLKNCLTPEDTRLVLRHIIEDNQLFMDAIRRAPSLEALMKMNFARRWNACQIMSSSVCLDADGTLYPCPGWNSMKIGNIREMTLEQMWTSSKSAGELRAIDQHEFPKCKDCNLHNFCDMCVVYNVNENGSVSDVSSRFCLAAKIRRKVVVEFYNRNIFHETARIADRGFYETENGQTVHLPSIDVATDARLYQKRVIPTMDDSMQSFDTKVSVVEKDCLVAAHELYLRYGSVCVLNNASQKNPGGSVTRGSAAQEEYLCMCSNYHKGLFKFVQPEARKHYSDFCSTFSDKTYPLDLNFGCCYVPHVSVFRDTAATNYKLLEEPWVADMIAVPALKYPDCIDRDGQSFLNEKDTEITLNKIRTIFSVALINNQTNIVMSAWGCGAFLNPPEHIAELFYKVLHEPMFENRFNNVVFAITKPKKQFTSKNLFDIFRTILDSNH